MKFSSTKKHDGSDYVACFQINNALRKSAV